MSALIGTAGHVDHGKTSLIRALSGIDTDRLPEEKARGLTIDLGFAYLDLPKVGRVSVVDVPGHERFLHNMLVGEMGVDVALLCVAADVGVMPQTQEHLQILSLLPVQKLIVVLTRCDLADADLCALTTEEVRAVCAETRFGGNVEVLETSALTGAGLDALREVLDRTISNLPPRPTGPWYLPIDRVFTIKGFGTVVTGTLLKGAINMGSQGVLQPLGVSVKVRALQRHDEPVPNAEPGMRIAVNLTGVDRSELERGMVLGAPGSTVASDLIEVKLEAVRPIKTGARIRLSLGAEEVMGKIFLSTERPEWAQLRLERRIGAVEGQSGIVRSYSPARVLGGVTVTVPQATRTGAVAAPITGTDESRILAVVSAAANGLPSEEIARQLGRGVTQLGTPFETLKASGKLISYAGHWIDSDLRDSLFDRVLAALRAAHVLAPQKLGVPRGEITQRAGLNWESKPIARLLQDMEQAGLVRILGNDLAAHDFVVELPPRQEGLLARVEELLNTAGANVPSAREISQALSIPLQATTEILRIGVGAGRLVFLAEDVVYTTGQIEIFRNSLATLTQPFAASDFRDAIQSSRKYVIPILEYFDAKGITLRQGDKRVTIR